MGHYSTDTMKHYNLFTCFMLIFIRAALSIPTYEPEILNNLTSPYTLVAYLPNFEFNGQRINNVGLRLRLSDTTTSYCDPSCQGICSCPNGADTVFTNKSPIPLSAVPGGQQLYINVGGLVSITTQHSHSIPAGAWTSVGWTWTALPISEGPTGFFNFQAPGASHTSSGIGLCKSDGTWQVYADTPLFKAEACEDWVLLKGFGTVPYTGVTPPVWAYS